MAGFTALALLLLLVTMAAARFGMASFVGRLLQVPVRLIAISVRSWACRPKRAPPPYRVALTPQDAPGLFAIARALSQRSATRAAGDASLTPPELMTSCRTGVGAPMPSGWAACSAVQLAPCDGAGVDLVIRLS